MIFQIKPRNRREQQKVRDISVVFGSVLSLSSLILQTFVGTLNKA